MTSARTRALSTPEVLEHILLQLDQRTLLLSAQVTCRTWTQLIRHSPTLQKALFFAPSLKGDHKLLCPLLVEKFPVFFPPRAATERGRPRPKWFTLTTLELAQPQCREVYLRKEASWRRMLVQQPAAARLVWFDAYSGEVGDGCAVNTVSLDDDNNNKGYVRMGTLFETILTLERFSFEHLKYTKIFYEPPSSTDFVVSRNNPSVPVLFSQEAERNGVLIYTVVEVTCVRGQQHRQPTADEELREQLFTAYEEMGVDMAVAEMELKHEQLPRFSLM